MYSLPYRQQTITGTAKQDNRRTRYGKRSGYPCHTGTGDKRYCPLRVRTNLPNPVLSTLDNFYDEYLEHVRDKTCRAKQCKSLLTYTINPEHCIGCHLCAKNCPADAISGLVRKPHVINPDKCIKCGMCMARCKFKAILVC